MEVVVNEHNLPMLNSTQHATHLGVSEPVSGSGGVPIGPLVHHAHTPASAAVASPQVVIASLAAPVIHTLFKCNSGKGKCGSDSQMMSEKDGVM